MGRGHRRTSAGDVSAGVDPTYTLVVADEAITELIELLTYIRVESSKNARSILAAVEKRFERLRRFPRTGHADPNAPLVPHGTQAFIVTVKSVSIDYLFPMRWKDREILYVVSIRRGSRMPLDDPEYLGRWMEELARLASPPGESPQERSTPSRPKRRSPRGRPRTPSSSQARRLR